MSKRDELNDALDSILGDRGSSPSVDPQLDRMVRGLRAAFPAPVISAAVSSRHLAVIGLASQGSPSTSAPAGFMDRIRQQMHSRTAKVAASALALSGSFSGLAVAGFLPDAVQESVADVAEMFGINLPRPDSVTASTEDSDGRRDEDETSGPAEEPEPSADGATADGDSDPDDQRHDDDSDDDDSDDEDRSGSGDRDSGDRDSGDRDSGDRDSDGDDSDDDDSSGSKGDGRYSGDRDRDGDDSDDSHTGGDGGGSGDDAVDIDAADSDDPDKGDSASDAEDLEVPDVGDGDDD